jgi:hypothetical protein
MAKTANFSTENLKAHQTLNEAQVVLKIPLHPRMGDYAWLAGLN